MILDRIVNNTREELKNKKKLIPIDYFKMLAETKRKPKDMAAALRGDKFHIIAEVKKASPSRGVIRNDFDPLQIAAYYARNGASAISILTDAAFFQGSLKYLHDINVELGETRPPLLRKDFILDPYQVYEARFYGADAVLLIAAILDDDQLTGLLQLSRSIGLKCLIETHNEQEVKRAVSTGAEIIGINNRDLQTFEVDIQTTFRLRQLIPDGRIVVSESGIKSREDIDILKKWDVNAALVGETLIASPDTGSKLRDLI
jgi:indole-3-glycerol phosphate synthase